MTGQQRNPWVTPDPTPADVVTPVGPVVPPATGPTAPQPGLVTAGPGGLQVGHHFTGPAPLVWVVGVHGGAGESTLTEVLDGRAGRRAWPVLDGTLTPQRVVLVARTHSAGLVAAQTVARQWAAGDTPPVDLLGLVLTADAPGKLPRPLRHLVQVVTGGVPRVWHLPWIEAWRLGEPADPPPRALTQIVGDVGVLASLTPTEGAPPCTTSS